jgi:hypothetical protein
LDECIEFVNRLGRKAVARRIAANIAKLPTVAAPKKKQQ